MPCPSGPSFTLNQCQRRISESDVVYFQHPQMFFQRQPEEHVEILMRDSFRILNGFLETSPYVTGDNFTIADLSILATVTLLDVISYDVNAFSAIRRWKAKLKSELPYYDEVNTAGVEFHKAAYLSGAFENVGKKLVSSIEACLDKM